MFAEYFLCNRGVLVSCDKNEYNIPKIIKNYDESSFGNVDGNCYLVETEDYTQTNIAVKQNLDVDKIANQIQGCNKFVYAVNADST